ncbi:sulfur oxidation c-type cytochrome SoxA [Microbaculum marinisediminis]|uniref:SoxAX cytochrome complex subunit A n=1 Tax=Microbaculum marinisediminis TaxID=2931392 RepID=A0AAW5R3B4_9HYPH|nr:sulfur oxidation c-type cytochrome SoxA [Microbaculum sp. A6E488]MCT8973343.1 sulfur oxidation c-type cytochrome SoxA [Microbaculum sp. A6E488]
MSKLGLAIALGGVVGLAFAPAQADPVDDTLVIDGKEMITRVDPPDGHPFDEVLSGWLFRTPETRALETDTFANPGMLYVEQGEQIWNQVDGAAGKSCASCHNDAAESMKDVGAGYPKWNAAAGKPYNLELQINDCRVNNMQAEPYKFDAGEQKALVTYIKHQSLGAPVKVDLGEGDMKAWWDKGKDYYYTRFGQLNLSCASCHEENNGNYIRADHLSQGNVNGFPTYRLKQASMVSLHNRFRGCIRDTRASYPDAFSDELMALEVYVTWRGTGLSVETPAVRQ